MRIKNKYICLITAFFILFVSGCNKKTENEENDKSNIKNASLEILKIIQDNSKININYNNEYNDYFMTNGVLYGYNYNNETSSYDYNINYNGIDNSISEIVVENSEKELYLSIKSNEYCAIKNFSDDNITIYESNNENCHLFQIKGESLYLLISGTNSVNNEIYQSNTISNNNIVLHAASNLIDFDSVNYKWYKNDQLISTESLKDYTATESGNYYFRMITPDKKVYKSKTISIVIEK